MKENCNKTIGKILTGMLREIYDDHDFICEAMSNAVNGVGWKKMIEYIYKQNIGGKCAISRED